MIDRGLFVELTLALAGVSCASAAPPHAPPPIVARVPEADATEGVPSQPAPQTRAEEDVWIDLRAVEPEEEPTSAGEPGEPEPPVDLGDTCGE